MKNSCNFSSMFLRNFLRKSDLRWIHINEKFLYIVKLQLLKTRPYYNEIHLKSVIVGNSSSTNNNTFIVETHV